MPDVLIQWLDSSGWATIRRIDPAGLNGEVITRIMREVQAQFPGKRIRAIDAEGRLIDILAG